MRRNIEPDRAQWRSTLFGPGPASSFPARSPLRRFDGSPEAFGDLTGWPSTAGIAPSPHFAWRVDDIGSILADLTGTRVDAFGALVERSRLQPGLRRGGTTSCGGSTRILRAADGLIALALPRESDVQSLPALLEADVEGTGRSLPVSEAIWERAGECIARAPSRHWTSRATLLGMAVGRFGECAIPTAAFPAVRTITYRAGEPVSGRPVVVDLSSLWAGPLCGHLLSEMGAEVVKVEDVNRPDGARIGSPGFFERLHRGQEMVRIDFSSPSGREELRARIESADVVIEASRPRALRAMGFTAEHLLAEGRVGTWVSITGFGRSGADGDRIAFGDDAAVAGGLVACTDDGICFLGDAVADPLTGLVAACAAGLSLRSGAGSLLDVAMTRVAAAFADRPERSGARGKRC